MSYIMKDQELLSLCNEYLNYDPETGIFIRIKSAKGIRIGDVAGYRTSAGYIQMSIKGKVYLAHRIAFLITYGYFPKIIDHINRDSSDNRISNLRECSQVENCRNRGINNNNTSGYKGVTKKGNKWRSEIRFRGDRKYLGSFICKHEAAKAYNEAAKKHHGEFAVINTIVPYPNI